jgi:xanthine dehydrogenase accessory factor
MKGRTLDHVVAAARDHRSVALATYLGTGRQLLLDGGQAEGDLALEDSVLDRVRNAWRSGRNQTIETAAGPVFVEVLTPPHRCFIVGAVHIAQPLARMAALTGYLVTVVDPRTAFASDSRFPDVAVSTDWPDEALEKLRPDRRTAVITLTHDPKLDDPALAVALRSQAFYIGALGSKKTHAARCKRLLAIGLSEVDLGRIHGPVGLDIGAISPAEIAISVMAQITQVLRAEPAGDREAA